MRKYNRWYNNIIDRAKLRTLTSYKEVHHIVPRALGGNDDNLNLVDLTAREHFICHWLLVKIHTGEARSKMINAMYMMRAEGPYQQRYKSKITSRVYEKLRIEYAAYISKRNTGRKQPPEEKERQIKAMTGRTRAPFSEEWRAKLSAAKKGENNNRYGIEVLEETRKKMSEKAKGRKYSAETIEKRASKIRGSKREKIPCPYCLQEIAVNTFSRWHGDNCKEKEANL
jgi:hypothetical protein